MIYTVRPITDRTPFTGRQKHSPFRAGWSSTVAVFDREFRAVAARDIVFELDVRDDDLRIDGQLRANARPATPAIRIAFESKHGPLVYATDRFYTWQDNARAIALTLQALRRIDDYEVVKRGEQYLGFKQIGAGHAMPASHMTSDEAWSILGSYGDRPIAEQRVHPDGLRRAFRAARIATHPDRHEGDHSLWESVEEAAKVLGVLA